MGSLDSARYFIEQAIGHATEGKADMANACAQIAMAWCDLDRQERSSTRRPPPDWTCPQANSHPFMQPGVCSICKVQVPTTATGEFT